MQFDISPAGRTLSGRVQIAIRVDYCPAISDTPIRRCLAIAGQLREQQARVLFVTADDGATSFIRGTGFGCHLLDSDWRDPEPEADVLIDYLEEEGIELLLIDQPRVTPVYLSHLREAGLHLALIDDQMRFPYDVELIVNPLPEGKRIDYDLFYKEARRRREEELIERRERVESAEEELRRLTGQAQGNDDESLQEEIEAAQERLRQYRQLEREGLPPVPDPESIRFLLGIGYKALPGGLAQSQIMIWRKEQEPLPNIEFPSQPDMASEPVLDGLQTDAPLRQAGLEPIRDLFLTLDGADTGGVVERMVTGILRDPELKDVRIHIYCGLFFRVTERLQIFLEDGRVFLHHEGEEDVARLMCRCEAGIAPGGIMLYELCACRCPGVSFYMTDVQREEAELFSDEELIPCAGDYRDDWKGCIAGLIRELHVYDRMGVEGRSQWGERAVALVDGQGAGRIAEALLTLQEER